MTGSARTRGFDGPPAEVNATTIRNPRGGSDGTRTYLVPSIYSSASPWVGSQPCGAKYPGFCADSKGV